MFLNATAVKRTVMHPGFEKGREVIMEVGFLEHDDCSGMGQKGVQPVGTADASDDYQILVG